MGLALSLSKRAQLGELLQILLSPLEHSDVAGWGQAITVALARTFTTGGGMCVLPDAAGGMRMYFSGLESDRAAPFQELVVGTRPGSVVFADPLMDRIERRLTAARVGVWNVPLIKRFTGLSFERAVTYNELVVPARVTDMTMMGVPLPAGHAMLGAARRCRGHDPSGEESLELAGLIVPAFRTGLQTLQACWSFRASLGVLLDRCQVGASIRDAAGREIHRNRALESLLAIDPDRARIQQTADALVRDLIRLREGGDVSSGRRPVATRRGRATTARGRYSLGASYLPPGSFAHGWSIVVTVASVNPLFPKPRDLQERFGLTRREAEVALLLARGASNREIAERLGVSSHTVRHHAQRVLEKLGVHSRKALALELIPSS